ncbi:MAG: NAD(P)H-hydrate dehydratase [Phyllobacteriaceae bacterium]|nr:NAD(P)H-hydrate dehydratase [Phyllobacteriaceae bacterium]
MHVLLLPEDMARADRLTIDSGRFSGRQLMARAGAAVADAALARFPHATRFAVLCGPGANGGDGYVAARLLVERGAPVAIFALGAPKGGTDAALAAAGCPLPVTLLAGFSPADGDVVIDALFGAGLARPLNGEAARAAQACIDAGVPVISVDVPSGLDGATGRAAGPVFRATLTVTFARLKPGHLLFPGRALCGETILADIGIPDSVIAALAVRTWRNDPALFSAALPRLEATTHKYARGAVAVCSGGPASTGAARLAAFAAARSGAGAVTVLSPPAALIVNAAQLTAIMVRAIADADQVCAFLETGKTAAIVLGPGFGVGERARAYATLALDPFRAADESGRGLRGVVLDADALTSFADNPDALFAAIGAARQACVLTPHEGEFARMFADLAELPSKLERARAAAARSGAVVVLKGPDTVIAGPDGRAVINANAPPWLATAGSGDVLAGLIAGLTAQAMPAFEAACAAVWAHGEAANRLGRSLIADDLPAAAGQVLAELAG